MSDASVTSGLRPRLQNVQGRKRSFGRMFDRIKVALRLRNKSDAREEEVVTVNTTAQVREDIATPVSAVTEAQTTLDLYAKPSSLLLVDDEENIPGAGDEAIVSLDRLGRDKSGISEATTKQFFARHGLTYHGLDRSHESEPAAKLRRVEKPVRMRVRWTCHSCRAVFGVDKYCPGCSHRRCFECHREPARSVNVDGLKDAFDAASGIATRRPVSTPVQITAVADNLDDEDDGQGYFKEPSRMREQMWRCTIQVGRPRADSHLISSLHHNQVRKHCHECERPVHSLQQTCCNECQHELCTLCPTMLAEPELKTVPTVERVFKKPRQRVRYNCEHCNLQFTNRHECSGCGHERCENCPRFPPRKTVQMDPTIIASMQAKLGAAATSAPPEVVSSEQSLPATQLARL